MCLLLASCMLRWSNGHVAVLTDELVVRELRPNVVAVCNVDCAACVLCRVALHKTNHSAQLQISIPCAATCR